MEIPQDAADDPVEEHREELEKYVDHLQRAAIAMQKVANIHQRSIEEADTVEDAAHYIDEAWEEEITEEEDESLNEVIR